MGASLNTWTIIFLVAALHGFVLSVLFFRKKEGSRSSNILLSIFLALFSVTLVDYVAYWTGYQMVYPHFTRISNSFTFLFGPILYLYVISILKPRQLFHNKQLIHFIPFMGLLITDLPFLILPATAKIELLQSFQASAEVSPGAMIIPSLKILHLSFYAVLILIMVRYDGFRERINTSQIPNYSKHWLNVISYCFIGFTLSYASYYLLINTIDFKIEYDYMISFAMTVFIFIVGYLGYMKPDALAMQESKPKYDNSNLTEAEAEQYVQKLLQAMESDEIYKEGSIRLKDLAEQLEIPSHHLSQVINDKLGQNFFEFINSYRVKEARKLLKDPENKNLTILHVAFESGFNNKTSFNRAFKEEIGITPSKFRDRHINGH